MIKDVKTYIHTVGNRLSKAFSIEEFGLEEQLDFWELSAEHVSRKETPSFTDIVSWMDMLYRAPVHFVYQLEDEKLVLSRRHVITENLLNTQAGRRTASGSQSVQEKELLQNFEHQLQNLEKKMSMDEVFREHGITAHSIGQCEHIPLFDNDGDLWGIYCAGPYIKSPEQITPKLSIVGRLLSRWLISLDEEEDKPQKDYESRIEEVTANLGSGKLNTEALMQLNLKYLLNSVKADSGCVFEFMGGGHKVLASSGFSEDELAEFTQVENVLVQEATDKVKVTEAGRKWFEARGENPDVLYFKGEHHSGFILLFNSADTPRFKVSDILDDIRNSFASILDYRYQNEKFSEKLTHVYYTMLRAIERSRSKTIHHTPRMIAFVERFGLLFGLEDEEMARIKRTAKLHDIGYVGASSIESGKSIGGELTHPLIGANMVEQLAVHPDITEGIKTHHEWVNGNGTPGGLKAEEIPWSGKIIGVFEYVVDFVETHKDDDSKSGDEWIEALSKGIMERADVEFDMVLIPTVIQLIQALGWEGCVNLGVD
ncbi:HD-GYP domain-containing protein [Gracilimonas mengyeensis]|uniref:HD domain-containing protein n=1 Tax=Gracilimonas mengyeensis TaxID=1302730 RepID=A0A521AI77_9BACT|nr:HD domain-containing phosphohydrolase [Gracilimonas mengyeensis]SMO34545.1 HD domain-containing protein [Gracilimonas mengyeensis]